MDLFWLLFITNIELQRKKGNTYTPRLSKLNSTLGLFCYIAHQMTHLRQWNDVVVVVVVVGWIFINARNIASYMWTEEYGTLRKLNYITEKSASLPTHTLIHQERWEWERKNRVQLSLAIVRFSIAVAIEFHKVYTI